MSKKLRVPQLLAFYQEYRENPDSATFTTRVSQRYQPGTLERLARHAHREVRRAAVLALGLVGDYESNATLGAALVDEDRTVRILAENSIRYVWTRAGDDGDRSQLEVLVRLNAAKRFEEVVRVATQLIDRSPALAEAWNQRGYAQHGLGRFADSVRDCQEALEINPYHFVAAVGMGRAYLELGNPLSALESFRRALRLHPDLQGVRAQVDRLARMVEGK
ncbi:MAG: tetratricopeptide repeat protein [Thermoguttaceae bacterium]